VIFNIITVAALCRKNLVSPATILMQGLALADCLTAFCSYGLEPLFLRYYTCETHDWCKVVFPYCIISTHLSILSMTFHTVSIMLTTCLGIQKVIAMKFPIWTKIYLAKTKAVICCIVCFIVAISFGFPRHFAIGFISANYDWAKTFGCIVQPISRGVLEYSSVYYLFIRTELMTCCSILMITCTIYIAYKLATNKFQGRQTQRRRQERKSIIMMVVVLVVFLFFSIPNISLYFLFCFKYVTKDLNLDLDLNIIHGDLDMSVAMAITLVMKFEIGMSNILRDYTDIANESSSVKRNDIFMLSIESMKVLTLIGCISNLIIYITLSSKLRMELKAIWRKHFRRLNVIEMN